MVLFPHSCSVAIPSLDLVQAMVGAFLMISTIALDSRSITSGEASHRLITLNALPIRQTGNATTLQGGCNKRELLLENSSYRWYKGSNPVGDLWAKVGEGAERTTWLSDSWEARSLLDVNSKRFMKVNDTGDLWSRRSGIYTLKTAERYCRNAASMIQHAPFKQELPLLRVTRTRHAQSFIC